MRHYSMTPSEVARQLASGAAVTADEVPLIQSAVSSRSLKLGDAVEVETRFAASYGIGRRYRSIATLALHLGCPMDGNPVEWLVQEVRGLSEARRS